MTTAEPAWMKTAHDRAAGRVCFCPACIMASQGPDVTPWPIRAAIGAAVLVILGLAAVWIWWALLRHL